jgi:hypothetical protein
VTAALAPLDSPAARASLDAPTALALLFSPAALARLGRWRAVLAPAVLPAARVLPASALVWAASPRSAEAAYRPIPAYCSVPATRGLKPASRQLREPGVQAPLPRECHCQATAPSAPMRLRKATTTERMSRQAILYASPPMPQIQAGRRTTDETVSRRLTFPRWQRPDCQHSPSDKSRPSV